MNDAVLVAMILVGPYIAACGLLMLFYYAVIPSIHHTTGRRLVAAIAVTIAIWHQTTAAHYYLYEMKAWARGMPDASMKERLASVLLSATTTWLLCRIAFRLIFAQPQRGDLSQPGVQPRV